MNSNGRGLYSVKSSAEGGTQSLQAWRGGLDEITKEADPLDDVGSDTTEIVDPPLVTAESKGRTEGKKEDMVQRQAIELRLGTGEFITRPWTSNTMLNPSSAPLLSETGWTSVLQGGRRRWDLFSCEGSAESRDGNLSGYYTVLGNRTEGGDLRSKNLAETRNFVPRRDLTTSVAARQHWQELPRAPAVNYQARYE